jgi:hypothetical protein
MTGNKVLFYGPSFHQLLQQSQQRVPDLIARLPEDAVLTGDPDKLARSILAELTGPLPVLDEANITTKAGETTARHDDSGRQFVQQRSYLTVYVPFTGDPQGFFVQPTQMAIVSTQASISNQEITFRVALDGKSKEQVEREIDHYVAHLRTHLDRLRSEQEPQYNAPLFSTIQHWLGDRRSRLEARQAVASSLKYKARTYTGGTTLVQVLPGERNTQGTSRRVVRARSIAGRWWIGAVRGRLTFSNCGSMV